ncbi:hypothetical protein ACJX0J_041455, partial [Zea mays]
VFFVIVYIDLVPKKWKEKKSQVTLRTLAFYIYNAHLAVRFWAQIVNIKFLTSLVLVVYFRAHRNIETWISLNKKESLKTKLGVQSEHNGQTLQKYQHCVGNLVVIILFMNNDYLLATLNLLFG